MNKEIEKMRKLVKEHNHRYYVLNEPNISDVSYDILLKKLNELEVQFGEAVTHVVGSDLRSTGRFTKVPHEHKMLSLDNSYNMYDIKEFIERSIGSLYSDIDICIEHKLDGLSLTCVYENGMLLRALTRGDGEIGEDVTRNALVIGGIPKFIQMKERVEIRGEVVMPLSKFKELNQENEEGVQRFANARNAASGSLKTFDVETVKSRGLQFYAYYIIGDELSLDTHAERFNRLTELGFQTLEIYLIEEVSKNMEALEKLITELEIKRTLMDIETDGLVIKLNKMSDWEKLGVTNKYPRYAIAFKFPAKQVDTIVKSITWQVGRTGKITPVAELKPVTLGGSFISRCTLHNKSEVERLGIVEGDAVFLEKAGEVIPHITSVIKGRRDDKLPLISPIPKNCPSCGGELDSTGTGVDLICNNPNCLDKNIAYLSYFVSKKCMNIDGLGEATLIKLFTSGLINKDPFSLYKLKDRYHDLVQLDKIGEKTAFNIIESIEKSKKNELWRVIHSLGIEFIGEHISRILEENFDSLYDIKSAAINGELSMISGLGSATIGSIEKNFISNEKIQEIESYGINIKSAKRTSGILNGARISATGSFNSFTRDTLKEAITNNSGVYTSSISKNLDYLIIGENPTSAKVNSATILNIKIITEDQFKELIEK